VAPTPQRHRERPSDSPASSNGEWARVARCGVHGDDGPPRRSVSDAQRRTPPGVCQPKFRSRRRQRGHDRLFVNELLFRTKHLFRVLASSRRGRRRTLTARTRRTRSTRLSPDHGARRPALPKRARLEAAKSFKREETPVRSSRAPGVRWGFDLVEGVRRRASTQGQGEDARPRARPLSALRSGPGPPRRQRGGARPSRAAHARAKIGPGARKPGSHLLQTRH